MQRNKLREERKAHVSRPIVTFVAVVAVAIIFVGCRRTDTNQNGNVPPATPSPSPTPSSSPGFQMLPGDTIIVIKDGSVRMKVNKTLCSDDDDTTQPDDKKYKCNYALREVGIQTVNGPTCVPTEANSKITIDGGGKEVEIKETGGAVMIKFKKAHYPPCPLGQPGEHCNLLNNVGTVKVGTTFTKTCDPAERCEIWVRKK